VDKGYRGHGFKGAIKVTHAGQRPRVGPKKNVRGAFFAVRNVLLLKSIIQWSDNESRDNGKHIWGIDHTGKDSNRKFNV
jgi:hypothetical protein